MKLVLFSVSYAGFWGQDRLGLEDFIRKAAELGYDGVMIMGKRPHAFPADMTPDRTRAVRDLLAEKQLAMCCMAAYTNFTAGAESREVPLVDMQVEYVASLARVTAGLGGDLVRIFTGYDVPGQGWREQWDQCVQGVQRCCDLAAEHSVRIGIQNHHDIAVETSSLLEFVNDVDRENVTVMFDAWSPALRGEDLTAAARLMGSRAAYTTVADYVRVPRYRYQPHLVNYERAGADFVRAVPMGEGFIDYQAFLNAMREAGFSGPVSYEMCSPLRGGGGLPNLDACARRFVEFMKTTGLAS